MKLNIIKKVLSGAVAGFICLTSVPFAAYDLDAFAASVGSKLSVGGGQNQFKEDNVDGYSYEIWLDTTGGSGSMTLGSGGTFDTQWSAEVSRGNFLARRGRNYDASKKATQYGPIVMDYAAQYSASSAGNSRLCVYGWFKNPLVEYYIIEDWVNWRPTGSSKTVTIDGAEYEIFQNDHTGPTILGTTETFKQYFSVRKQKRTSGKITVSDHFQAWADAGWNIGNLTEVALNVEGWESSGRANVTKLTVGSEDVPDITTEPTTLKPVEPDSDGFFFKSGFESGKDGWSGRGDASVAVSDKYAASGSSSLFVSDRGDNWHGAAISLDPAAFQAGKSYSFSTNVLQDSGSAVDMKFTLQYELDGEAHYDEVASASAESGVWTQLQNTSFEIPSGASDMVLYVEAPDSLTDFYIDDVAGGVDGTSVTGPKTTKLIVGDVNFDGVINSFDLILAKQGLVDGVTDNLTKKAIDADGDGKIAMNDLVLISEFVLHKITSFPEPVVTEPPTTTTTAPPKSNFNYNSAVSFKEAPGNYFGSCQQEGKIVKESYNGINGNNSLNVYLPYGYDKSKKYNIFYLMHGGGEDQNTLFYNNDTQIQHMFDHMIMNGEMEPMIVVTPTFNKCEAGTFYNEFRKSVVPFVEGKYSTYANGDTSEASIRASRMHRAYGGFSMGSVSTWAVMQNCLDIVGYFMPLSGDHWQGEGAYGKAKSIADAVDKSGLSSREFFIFAATGSDDIAYPNISPQIDEMKKMSQFVYTSDFSKGNFYFLVAQGKTHWWGYVRHYVYDALPYFFHEGQ